MRIGIFADALRWRAEVKTDEWNLHAHTFLHDIAERFRPDRWEKHRHNALLPEQYWQILTKVGPVAHNARMRGVHSTQSKNMNPGLNAFCNKKFRQFIYGI